MSKQMRILHVSHQYPPAVGGSEKYIADLSTELASRGHQVDVFTSRSVDYHTWRNELPNFEKQAGVSVYRYRSLQRRAYVWKMLQFGLERYWIKRAVRYEPFIFFGGGPLAPGLFWTMLRRGHYYDLVHLNSLVYSHTAYGYWAAKKLGLPVVVTPHVHAEQPVTYDIGYQRRVLSGVDHVIADTLAEQTWLTSELGLSSHRVSHLGVGIKETDYRLNMSQAQAREQLGVPKSGFSLLFLGRKTDYKGLDVTLRAYEVLKSQGCDIHLLAIGPETDYSENLWPQYAHLTDVYRFGKVTDSEKVMALQACDCLVMPSVGEAFGIVYLEAWMMGKPVIGAQIKAVSSLIQHDHDGWLIAADDVSDLAEKIKQWVLNPTLAKTMGQRGLEKVQQRYTTTQIGDRAEAIYQQVLAKKL
ncbi:MAG: glycosyltransferase family 4 protein [Chloroflexota bacterium]